MVLPRYRTDFVGRAPLLDALRDAIAVPGLVTLHGPGGVGKTRLATEVSGQLTRPVEFVGLADAHTAADLADTVAAAIGCPIGDQEPAGAVGSWLSRRPPSVLVLDNFEQLEPASRAVLVRWLTDAPTLTILVTSRHVLDVEGERVVRVEPLSEPEAIRLFSARTAHLFDVTDPTRRDRIARVVHQLDGLPLAIELGAARVEILGLDELCDRLETRFRVLKDPLGQGRHSTLRAVIAWSWDLLSEDERGVLHGAAVFQGGLQADAASAVLGVDDIEARLDDLVSKSLLQRQGDRWYLLESVRAYARERAGDDSTWVARHARWYADASRTWVDTSYRTGDLSRLRAEYLNLKAALAVAAPEDEPALAVALAKLSPVLGTRQCEFAASALERLPDPARGSLVHAELLARRAELRWDRRLFPEGQADLDRAIAILRELDEPVRLITFLTTYGSHLCYAPEDREADAERCITEALDLARAAGERRLEAIALAVLAKELDNRRGQRERASARCAEAADILADIGDPLSEIYVRNYLQHIHHCARNAEQAIAAGERAVALVREHDVTFQLGSSLAMLATSHAIARRPDRADPLWTEALAAAIEGGDHYWERMIRQSMAIHLGWQRRYRAAHEVLDGNDPLAGWPPPSDDFAVRAALRACATGAASARDDLERSDPKRRLGHVAQQMVQLIEAREALWLAQRQPGLTAADAAADLAKRGGSDQLMLGWLADVAAEVRAAALGWLVQADGQWFETPDGDRIEVHSQPNRRILAALARPGLRDVATLLQAGWPETAVESDAGRNRVYVAISALRKAGFTPVAQVYGQGWRLEDGAHVSRCA